MLSCKIFFQVMVTIFKENLNLQLLLSFYNNIMFVIEIVVISEQITELNVFSCMIVHLRLKPV